MAWWPHNSHVIAMVVSIAHKTLQHIHLRNICCGVKGVLAWTQHLTELQVIEIQWTLLLDISLHYSCVCPYRIKLRAIWSSLREERDGDHFSIGKSLSLQDILLLVTAFYMEPSLSAIHWWHGPASQLYPCTLCVPTPLISYTLSHLHDE